jgi:hypothetical protein
VSEMFGFGRYGLAGGGRGIRTLGPSRAGIDRLGQVLPGRSRHDLCKKRVNIPGVSKFSDAIIANVEQVTS